MTPNHTPTPSPRNFGGSNFRGSRQNPNQENLQKVLQGSNPRNNNFRGRRGPSNNQPSAPKTNSLILDNPQYIKRREYDPSGIPAVLANLESIRNVRDTQIPRGNLAIAHLNPSLVEGPRMKTNSPEFFPEGPAVRFIPIGGSNEVGLNMNAIECGDDIILIDTGIGFGDNEKFPGVNYIAPDTSYLEQNKHKIKGLIYTHGHLDHIGAAPYVLPKLGPIPIYSMPLTLALLKNRLSEFEIEQKFTAKIIDLNETLTLGCFKIQFFRLNHSIPDVVGICIDTPMGRIVFCTDWKFDDMPYDGQLSDYAKLAQYGSEGVRLLMTDSLGILKPGKSLSENTVKKTIMSIFKECKERVIVTAFASTIPRMQFVVDSCIKYNRKLALIGRSMVNNFNICFQLGYIKVPPNLIVDIHALNNLPSENVCMLMTGSQGEDLAALTRLSRDEHDLIKLQAGDSVIFSSRPIEGNENAVENLVASLSRKGVDVYSNKEFSVHVGGHACQDDLKLLFALTKPDYLQPLHGDHYIIRKTAELGMQMGIPFEHCVLSENGRVTEMRYNEVLVTDEKVSEGYLLVDGMTIGSVSEEILEERRSMATQGTVVVVLTIDKSNKLVAGPELISRGFIYRTTGMPLFDEVKSVIKANFGKINTSNQETFMADLKALVKNLTSEVIYAKTEKSPIVIPVILQV